MLLRVSVVDIALPTEAAESEVIDTLIIHTVNSD